MVDLPDIVGKVSVRGDGSYMVDTWHAGWEAALRAQAAEAEAARKKRWTFCATKDGYTRYDLDDPQQAAAYQEQCEKKRQADLKRREDKLRKQAPERDAVIKRYGSEDAALAPCEREKLLRAAVKRWSKFCPKPHQRWTKSIDGYSDAYEVVHGRHGGKKPSKRIIDAISQAYPLPDTIEEAIAEEAYWHRKVARNRARVQGRQQRPGSASRYTREHRRRSDRQHSRPQCPRHLPEGAG